jgi:hypothetical protein
MSDNGLEPGPVQSKVRSQKMIFSKISCILVATSKRYVGLYYQEQHGFLYVLHPRCCCCSPANWTQVISGQLASSVGHITIAFSKTWYPRRNRKGKFHNRLYMGLTFNFTAVSHIQSLRKVYHLQSYSLVPNLQRYSLNRLFSWYPNNGITIEFDT